jgi:hypothetical protein
MFDEESNMRSLLKDTKGGSSKSLSSLIIRLHHVKYMDSFASTLLPPTAETLQHILVQGGIPPHSATHHTRLFNSLLDETRAIITSPNFERVLELCLDRTTEILFDGLRKNVFAESEKRVDETGQDMRLRLAGLLPGLARWSHLALNGLPNELVDVSSLILLGVEGAYVCVAVLIGSDGCKRGRGVVCGRFLKVRRSLLMTGLPGQSKSEPRMARLRAERRWALYGV